jgi:hypothetical protein
MSHMTRKILFFATIGFLFQSCGFWLYNYRAAIDSNFVIPNEHADTTIRYKVGQMIFRQSFKSDLYHRFASKTYDTLGFYGPDYHTLKFRISESNKSTNVHFTFFAFNGWRSRPPNKLFIQSFRDSLKNKFGATETVVKDFNNEKRRKNGT